jgi:hypothetical protein
MQVGFMPQGLAKVWTPVALWPDSRMERCHGRTSPSRNGGRRTDRQVSLHPAWPGESDLCLAA